MGIHICVYDKDGNELPVSEWDYIRQGHDRQFPDLIQWDNTERGPKDNSKLEDCFRPKDISRIRTELHALGWNDCARYDKLLDLLERGCWVYFSW